jgi:hypothetical protein
VVGALQRPTATTTLSEEVYVQSFGADGDIDAMLEVAELDRVARGEVWLLHRWYGALSISQEIAPLVHASVGTIVGFDDPSALLTGSVAVSVSDQADLAIGLFHGLGKRPVDREASLPLPPELDLFSEALPTTYTTLPKSEFGLYPTVAYVKLAAYF